MFLLNEPNKFFVQYRNACCFVECEQNRILLLLRHDHKAEGAKWEPPIGKANPDEPIRAVMERVLRDETGITETKGRLRHVSRLYAVVASHQDFVQHTFVLKVPAPRPDIVMNRVEHKEYRWMTLEEALMLPLTTGLAECLRLHYKFTERPP